MTARWAVRAADRARRSELAPQAPERVWGDALHRKGTGFPPYPSASSIPLFLEWLAQTVGQRDRYGGGGYPVAAPTDRKLPTFMKHAQHPTLARHCQFWPAATPEGTGIAARNTSACTWASSAGFTKAFYFW